MEVHHHPHVEKKSFREYLLEGLMIFVAVTMGFFAESIREHIVNREKEKSSIESIVKSTVLDTVHLHNTIDANSSQIKGLDSLVLLKNEDATRALVKWKIYYYVFRYGLSDYYFLPNNAGIEQLKSSGTLSLVQDQSVADSIQYYDNFNRSISLQEQDDHYVLQQLLDQELKLIDMSVISEPSVGWQFQLHDSTDGFLTHVKAINPDMGVRQSFFGYVTVLSASNRYYIIELEEQLQRARNLINFLKAKYDLKED